MKDTKKKAWKCGEGAKTSCKCHGTLYYGPTKRPDNDKDIKDWEDMREWKTLEKESNEWLSCSEDEFGGDPWPDQEKQCWCEDKMPYKPWHCADDGDDCMCDGWVVYGQKNGDDKKPLTFFEMIKKSIVIGSAGGKGQVQCSAGSFDGADPLEGGDKACFCDAEKKFFDVQFVKATKMFWKSSMMESQAESELESTSSHVTEIEKSITERTTESSQSSATGEVESGKALDEIAAGR